MIEVKNLVKAFDGGAPVLSNLDLCVQKGSIYGLIGKNGAGKTTIIQLLAGVLKEDAGEILIAGEQVWDNEKVKMKVGVVADEPYFYPGSTLQSMSKFYADIYKNWDEEFFHQLSEHFHLDPKKNLRRFSKGMKKQAYLALTLACRPDYLLLDEPMDGLDPIVRKSTWNIIIDEVCQREMSVLISSHNLSELEGMCDTIGILSKGKLLMEKELDAIRNNIFKVQVAFEENTYGAADFDNLNVVYRESRGSVTLLIVRESAEKIHSVIGTKNPKIFDILPLTLEEIFIYELGGDDDELKELL